jgi:hypothetical protein
MKPYELEEWNGSDDVLGRSNLISVCCGTRPWGEVYDAPGCPPTGICSNCHDHTTFEQEIDDD